MIGFNFAFIFIALFCLFKNSACSSSLAGSSNRPKEFLTVIRFCLKETGFPPKMVCEMSVVGTDELDHRCIADALVDVKDDNLDQTTKMQKAAELAGNWTAPVRVVYNSTEKRFELYQSQKDLEFNFSELEHFGRASDK